MSRAASARAGESPRFAFLILGATALAALLDLRFHAPWRDELQAWALARGSPTLPALFENLRAEAHPPLWYLLLKAAQLISHDPILLPIVHSLCACTAVWLLVRYAPFPRWLRLLAVLGYFIFFAYFSIARGYVLVELLGFACCLELRGARRGWVLAILLALLAQTELQGAVLGAGLCAGWLFLERSPRKGARARLPQLALGISSYTISALLCLFEIHRRADLVPEAASTFIPVPARAPLLLGASDALKALLPFFLHVNVEAWSHAQSALAAIFLCALLAALTFCLRRSSAALACWLVSAGLLFLVSQRTALTVRHYGMLVVAFIASLWLAGLSHADAAAPSPADAAAQQSAKSPVEERLRTIVLALFFTAQAISGVADHALDLLRPYSSARAAARFLQREHLTALPLICDRDAVAIGVAALIDRPCFFPSTQTESRFTTWGPQRRSVGQAQLVEATARLLQRSPSVVLVLTHALEKPIPGTALLATFLDAKADSERFYLYRAEATP